MTPQSKSSKSKSSQKTMTFMDILKQDHDQAREVFEQIEEDEDSEKREELFAGLQTALEEHMDLEERLFYPVLEQNEASTDKALESLEEHHVAKMVLNEFNGLDVENDRWMAKFKVLQEVVNHHMQEEEKNIFKMVKKVMEPDQIKQITDQVQQMKSEAQKKAA